MKQFPMTTISLLPSAALGFGGGEAHVPLQDVVQGGGREVAGADAGGGWGGETPKSVLPCQE
jgi:hypothetical protein